MKSLRHLLHTSLAACLFGAAAHAQQPTAPPPEDTQPPAPIVRPNPVVPKPAPVTGAQGMPTGTNPGPASKRAVKAASGTPGTTGATVTPSPAAGTQLAPGTAVVNLNRTTIVLDPSHGGVDGGSRITDSLQEKDVDLAFADRLRALLLARGFTVQLTRDADSATPADSGTPLTLDDRAGFANHFHPVACLLIHSTSSGKGAHLYSSELAPLTLQPVVVPWLSAQASWVTASRALQKQLGTALNRAGVPTVLSRASIRPLDSLTCPALVLEIAPNGSDKDTVNDASYQQRIAAAIASAMIFWQNQAQPPDRQLPAPQVARPTAVPETPGAQP